MTIADPSLPDNLPLPGVYSDFCVINYPIPLVVEVRVSQNYPYDFERRNSSRYSRACYKDVVMGLTAGAGLSPTIIRQGLKVGSS